MNNSENPNTVQPTDNGIPTVNPNVVPTQQPLPTVPEPTPSVTSAPNVVEKLDANDPRSVGIDNKEFIHPEAFGKMNIPPKDDGAVVNEKLKKVEVEYKPPSKFKIGLMIFFFIFLIAFVIFLPDITSYMELRFSNSNGGQVEKITNGKMRCEISSSTTNLDKNFEYVFHFSDNQLNRVEYTAITKGDPSLDEATLNEMNDVCKRLSADTEAIVGVTVRCNYTEGKLTETQSYDLKNLDMTEVRSTFAEAGGTNPEYPYGQDMDVIERSMIASGFECKRES